LYTVIHLVNPDNTCTY